MSESYFVRNVADTKATKSGCGLSIRLITHEDTGVANIHFVHIVGDDEYLTQ